MQVGTQDVLLPTSMVGNYPNPRWYDGQAFAQFPKGDFIFDAISREAFEDAVGADRRRPGSRGMDIISDGKVYGGDSPYGRSSTTTGADEGLQAVRPADRPADLLDAVLPDAASARSPRVPVPPRAPARRAQGHQQAGEGLLHRPPRARRGHHDSTTTTPSELALGLAKAFNEDFKELADNGVDIIQLDEFVWPYGMGDWEIEALNAAVEGRRTRSSGCTPAGATTPARPAYFPDEDDDGVRRLRARQAGRATRPAPSGRTRSSRRCWTRTSTR